MYVDRPVLELLDQMYGELEEGQKNSKPMYMEATASRLPLRTWQCFLHFMHTPGESYHNNQYLQRAAALLGFTVPSPKELLGRTLHNMKAQVEVGTRPPQLFICDVK